MKSAPPPSVPGLCLLSFMNVFCACFKDLALTFLLAPAAKDSWLRQGCGFQATLDFPREIKRDRRTYLHWHPRKLSRSACEPSVNRWDSVCAAMFCVMQQILAGHQAVPGPVPEQRERGRVRHGSAIRSSWSWKLLGRFLCCVRGCLGVVGTVGDRVCGWTRSGGIACFGHSPESGGWCNAESPDTHHWASGGTQLTDSAHRLEMSWPRFGDTRRT